MVVGIGRTCFALSHVLSSALSVVLLLLLVGGDQLIIYLAICGARVPTISKIIWIRQTGAHTHSGREQKKCHESPSLLIFYNMENINTVFMLKISQNILAAKNKSL